MNIKRVLLKAINHKEWVSIEYSNKEGNITKYWIGIRNYHIVKNNKTNDTKLMLNVDLFNVTKDDVKKDCNIYFDSILTAKNLEGTYFEDSLVIEDKLNENQDEVDFIFTNNFDDNILNYFSDCYKLDNTPYISKYSQILGIDQDTILENDRYYLSDTQFKNIIKNFSNKKDERKVLDALAMNEISIHTDKGLYVLAYRVLTLDIENKALVPDKHIILNKAFNIKHEDIVNEVSARQFLDEEDYYLLDDIKVTKEQVCDAIMKNVNPSSIDDSPHILSLGRDYLINIDKEYLGIKDASDKEELSYPLRSFFGQINTKPDRRVNYPIVLASEANLDQLLVIQQALKYPVTFVQGPPGTGKTKTITNVLINCIFNEKTVLVSTNNNIPLDGIFNGLAKLAYKDNPIIFPMLRLGSDDNIAKTLEELKNIIPRVERINSDDDKIEAVKKRYIAKKNELKVFLEKYANKVELEERLATLKDTDIKDAFSLRSFDIVDSQIEKIEEKLKEYEDINEDNELVKNTKEIDRDILMYLYYQSANLIKKIKQPKYNDLINIIHTEDEQKRVSSFKHYIAEDENLEALLKIFPIIFTTNTSAFKLASPKPHFDLVIMDEAGQCNAAIALLPILRGENLLLVGDTCQLKPVIVLDPVNNESLVNKYKINETYDYIENSILKMYYTNDTVSNIILLKNHYRCDPKIINFNNQKFYNKKLLVKSISKDENPLVFVDVADGKWAKRNTSVEEANIVIDYCKNNKEQKIGIITPFVNQRNLINERVSSEGLEEVVSCGTIHEFQGDEKDVIIFSTAITSKTSEGTYKWLMQNKELFNVATSRAKNKLIILGNEKAIDSLHKEKEDIFYELYQYVKKNGDMEVTFLHDVGNRALDIKPFSSELEKAFLDNLLQVIECNFTSKIVFRKEVAAASIFNPKLNEKESAYFYSCRFDFVLFDKNNDYPLLAIELCGPEHQNNEVVIKRDEKKKEICKNHNFDLMLVDNAYARRYGQLKTTLLSKLFAETKKEITYKKKEVVQDTTSKDLEEIAANELYLKEQKRRKEHELLQANIHDFFDKYVNLVNNGKIREAYEHLQNNTIKEIDEYVKRLIEEEFKKGLFKSIKYAGNKNECVISKYVNNSIIL